MSVYNILIVDDDETHLEKIKSMIDEGLRSMRSMLGLLSEDEVKTDIESDAGKAVSSIEAGLYFPYNIIISDIFMPLDGSKFPCVEGGAKRIYQAIKKTNLQDDIILVVITNRDSEATPHFREILREQRTLSNPWMVYIAKPEVTPGPNLEERLLDDNTWTYSICRAIAKYRDKEWRKYFIKSTLYDIVGSSVALMEAKVKAEQFAEQRVIMLTGETGTGKELIAQAIHRNSTRKNRKYVAINCNAYPEGVIDSELFGHVKGAFTGAGSDRPSIFEQSNDGTVFIDEFGANLHYVSLLDEKLRRLIQFGEYEKIGGTRTYKFKGTIIFGGSNLAHLIPDREISRDLYRRIKSYRIDLPPLRERKPDIIPLAEFFLKKYSADPKTLSKQATEILTSYNWPGNVGELEELMEKFATTLMKDVVDVKDLQRELEISSPQIPPDKVCSPITKEVLITVMNMPHVNGVLWKAAHELYPDYLIEACISWKHADVSKLIKRFSNEDSTFLSKIPYSPKGGRPSHKS